MFSAWKSEQTERNHLLQFTNHFHWRAAPQRLVWQRLVEIGRRALPWNGAAAPIEKAQGRGGSPRRPTLAAKPPLFGSAFEFACSSQTALCAWGLGPLRRADPTLGERSRCRAETGVAAPRRNWTPRSPSRKPDHRHPRIKRIFTNRERLRRKFSLLFLFVFIREIRGSNVQRLEI